VVERLGGGWTLIDNEFVDQVAHLAGLPRDEVARHEERAPGLLERLARTLAVASPEMFITTGETPVPVETEEDLVTQTTERVIAEAAAEGRVVLVGRGAQAVLATRPNALHVYVIASKPFRRKVAIQRLGVDTANVDKVIGETDQHRDQYVKTHYGRDRQDLTQYDVVLNAERLGFEGAAELIAAEVRRRRWV
jgi:cytidylate kinase